MDIIDNIIHYFKGEKDKKEKSSPEGTCSICWGYQQYDGKIRDLLKDKQVDVNNHKASYMIIQEFVKTNIDGFIVKESEFKSCPTCGDKEKNRQSKEQNKKKH